MEPNISQETIKINKEIFNQTIELPIELDYQLPDYYTGIFKMLQFRSEPHICSFRSSSNQFTIDGITVVKLIYIDEDAGNLKAIHQNIPFSKTLKLKSKITKPCIFYEIKNNYSNCKIISSKKIEIKGSLTLNLKLFDQIDQPILNNLNIEEIKKTGIHIKKQPINLTTEQLWNNHQFKISEQIAFEKPVKEILDVKINVIENEHKTILNKIISKATAYIEVIYCSDDKKTTLTQKTSCPINQILEMQGVNENFICDLNYDISTINTKTLQEGKIIKIEADGLINGYGSLTHSQELITDIFSTKFKIAPSIQTFKTCNINETIKENLSLNETFDTTKFQNIIDLNSIITDLSSEVVKNKINFNAKLTINAYGKASDETPEIFEKSIPISFSINKKLQNDSDNEKINAKITILENTFQIDENKNLNIKINFQVNCTINYINKIKIINDVKINETEKIKKTSTSMTLFYPEKNDDIWNIAKQFSTCPKEIMEANSMKSEIIKDEIMLIIPIV